MPSGRPSIRCSIRQTLREERPKQIERKAEARRTRQSQGWASCMNTIEQKPVSRGRRPRLSQFEPPGLDTTLPTENLNDEQWFARYGGFIVRDSSADHAHFGRDLIDLVCLMNHPRIRWRIIGFKTAKAPPRYLPKEWWVALGDHHRRPAQYPETAAKGGALLQSERCVLCSCVAILLARINNRRKRAYRLLHD
jgi:hypothetical protein